jgi:hypothetical protein
LPGPFDGLLFLDVVTETIPEKRLAGNRTLEAYLTVCYLQDLPVSTAWSAFDVNFLAYLEWIWPKKSDTVFHDIQLPNEK